MFSVLVHSHWYCSVDATELTTHTFIHHTHLYVDYKRSWINSYHFVLHAFFNEFSKVEKNYPLFSLVSRFTLLFCMNSDIVILQIDVLVPPYAILWSMHSFLSNYREPHRFRCYAARNMNQNTENSRCASKKTLCCPNNMTGQKAKEEKMQKKKQWTKANYYYYNKNHTSSEWKYKRTFTLSPHNKSNDLSIQ